MAFDPITGILNIGGRLIDKLFPDKTKAAQAKARLFELQQQGELQEMGFMVKGLLAELQGNWLQRSWRPILMLAFTYIIVHNYVFVPVLGLTAAEIPPDMWSLLKIGVGGYVMGRSAEKGIQVWKAKQE